MFCHQCGTKQSKAAKFCHDCGQALASTQQAPDTETKKAIAPNNAKQAEYFYAPSANKFIILSVLTFNLYFLFWFARNWNLVQDQEKSKIWPIARAIFAIFFVHELAEKVLGSAKQKGYSKDYNSVLLTILFIAFSIAAKLPDGYWLITLLAFGPLLPIVNASYFIAEKTPNSPISKNWSATEIIIAIIGALITGLAVLGTV